MSFFSYVVLRDYGFAPNPFHNYCTLSSCMVDIREHAAIDDWIIGTGSKTLGLQSRLIYVMKITEILHFDDYFQDERFQLKKPDLTKSKKFAMGDNFRYLNQKNWKAIDSHHYNENGANNIENTKKDTSIPYALISNHFLYFGKKNISIPEELHFLIKSGQGYKRHFSEDEESEIEIWIESLFQEYGNGAIGYPSNC